MIWKYFQTPNCFGKTLFFHLVWQQSLTVQQPWTRAIFSYSQYNSYTFIFWQYKWDPLSSSLFKISYTISEPTFSDFKHRHNSKAFTVNYLLLTLYLSLWPKDSLSFAYFNFQFFFTGLIPVFYCAADLSKSF